MNELQLKLNLKLFDGGAAGGAGDGGAAAGTTGTPSDSREGNGETQVTYGKQPEGDGAPAAEEQTIDPKQREADFRKLITGEYKDLYTQETQRIINKRFSETKGLQESLDAQAPIMDALRDRYGVDSPTDLLNALNSDANLWQDAAEEAGLTMEQFQHYKAMERQNAMLQAQIQQRIGRERAQWQMQQWQSEAADIQNEYPDFNLQAECQNPEFMKLLQSHVPMKHAYKLLHMDEIMQANAEENEKKLTDTIRSRGKRPAEGGSSSQTGITTKSDVHALTPEDRRAIAEKVRRGEAISF